MQKILFNDKYLLTKAVLEGGKTQTRRILKSPSPYKNTDIAFPVGWTNEDEPEKDPLYGAFCWVNKDNPKEHTDWVKPQFRVGEVVAVAQSYESVSEGGCPVDSRYDLFRKEDWDEDKRQCGKLKTHKGWNNKMFVKAQLMPHQIRITNVRLQHLQDISDEDCLAEGIIRISSSPSSEAKSYAFYDKAIKIKVQRGKEFITYTGYKEFDTPREAYAALIDKISGKGTWDSNPWVWAYTFELK